jgi:hypothetical protein
VDASDWVVGSWVGSSVGSLATSSAARPLPLQGSSELGSVPEAAGIVGGYS